MLEQLDTSHINRHLGQKSEYSNQYDKSLLVREPRSLNRTQLHISDDMPPFTGYDIWNGYEVSCLLNNGLPTAATAKVVYSATNKYIVESKSMKLYWNSFNMTKMGDSRQEALTNIECLASADLSALLETDVKVKLFDSRTSSKQLNLFEYVTIEDLFDVDACNVYSETPDLLKEIDVPPLVHSEGGTYLHSSLLKSNCKITSQPDWGDVFIYYRGDKHIDPSSLIKYIVSFRDECHFHEEICETIYKRIWDIFSPKELSVMCLYTRRGGWDIVPVRVSHSYLLSQLIVSPNIHWAKTGRQ